MYRVILILSMIYAGIALNCNAVGVEWALYDVPSGSEFHNGVAAVRHGEGYELMSECGKIITDKHFKRINGDELEFGYCQAKNANGETGLINIKGEWILPPSNKYDFFYWGNGVFEIIDKETDKKALFANGHFITTFKYEFVNSSFPFMDCTYNDTNEAVNIITEDIIKGSVSHNDVYTNVKIKDATGQNKYLYYDVKTGERIFSKDLQTSIENISVDIDGYDFRLIYADSRIPLSDAKYLFNGDLWVNNRLIGYDNMTGTSYIFNEFGQQVSQVNSMLFHCGPYLFRTLEGKYYDYNGNIINDASSLYHIDGSWYKVKTADGSSYLFNAQKNKKYEFENIGPISEGMIIGSVADRPCYFNTETEKVVGPFNCRLNPFQECVAVIDEKNNERIIDKTGKSLLNFRREFPTSEHFSIGKVFSEGVLSVFAINGGEGYIYNPLSKERLYRQDAGGEKFTSQLERKAQEAFEKKEYAVAQKFFYQIFEIDNSQLWALSNYAACLINQGFNDEAIETCEMILAQQHDHEHALKLKSLAENNIEALSHGTVSDEFETVANHNSVWNTVESIAQTLMNLTGQHVPQSYNSFSEGYNEGSHSSEDDINSSNIDYQSQYDRWANVAERHYNSLTNLGYSYTDKSGQKKGSSGHGASPGKYTMMKRSLREAQREMRNIRQRARRAGVNISQSKWETATVDY